MSKRILIVDHHADFAKQLKTMLEASACIVEIRTDAISGGVGASSFKPEAAVVDMDLPAGGGKIIYRVLRTNAAIRDIPVVLLVAPGPRKVWEELDASPHPTTLVLRRSPDLRLLVPTLKILLGLA